MGVMIHVNFTFCNKLITISSSLNRATQSVILTNRFNYPTFFELQAAGAMMSRENDKCHPDLKLSDLITSGL